MTNRIIALIAVGLLAIPVAANAGSICFDEYAPDNTNGPMPADRYSSLGVTFNATDDGTTWDGLSDGDPGNWDLEGTCGSTFSGFNGNSYGLTMLFSTDVEDFALDAARSNGSSAGNELTVQGWHNGSMVEMLTLVLGDVNSWTTFALSSVVDEVRLFGTGAGFHPFGIDNIRWNTAGAEVPEPGTLALLGSGLLGIGLVRRRRKS